ncbi:threonylcarbamoyl-AMP synthase [Mycoplasmatota bacterium]|nr:threonylcarbamoyl-AMP synthase [Mycoplasmatota bacterium]
MKTKIYQVNQDDFDTIINHSAQVIKAGGLVVFPTETVYGIGANALDSHASKKIYQVKGRPSDNPLIVHIANHKDVYLYAKHISQEAKLLMDAFWPGPLTLVLTKTDLVPQAITGGLNTIAIRFPRNPIAQALITSAKLPICAPSANISGTPSSTTFDHVFKDLNGKVDVIIDGGMSHVGLESTVLDLTGKTPVILRPGAITKSMIEKALNKKISAPDTFIEDESIPKAPGMKYRHYAPKGQVTLLDGNHQQIKKFIKDLNDKNIGLIASDELCDLLSDYHTFKLGSIHDIDTIAKNIFLALRTMDNLDIKTIYIEAIKDQELGTAIMNRLLKAANRNIIHL